MPHNLDTSLLRAFVAAAETGGMTSAARLVNLTQAAVSQQVKRLEETFGRQLFERDRRGLHQSLSAEGGASDVAVELARHIDAQFAARYRRAA